MEAKLLTVVICHPIDSQRKYRPDDAVTRNWREIPGGGGGVVCVCVCVFVCVCVCWEVGGEKRC